MSHLAKQLCFLVVCALVLTGCKPINDLFGIDEPSTTTSNPPPEFPGEPGGGDPPPPPPGGQPPPPEVPDPEPGVPTVVLDTPTLIMVEGASGNLPVRLSSQPEGDVVVTFQFTANDGSIAAGGVDTLTFTTSNWDRNQNFQFSAPQDENATDGLALADILMDGTRVAGVVLVSSDDEVAQNDGVRITVKDTSGAGSVGQPVVAVIPLEYGKFQDTSSFRLRDGDDNPVQVQFEVLNRWWARDNSIRHVVAHFRANAVPAGSTDYFFKTDGGAQASGQSVNVNEAGNTITVDTGRVRFSVLKNGFNLFNDLYYDANGDGQYAASERVIEPGASEGPVFTGRLAGDIQRAKDRNNINVTIEETGPVRVVIRLESLGQFTSTSDHDHGFAVRIYAWAGLPYVKVDYQLQNSAKNVMYSWPLYFEDVSLNVKTTLTDPVVRFGMDAGQSWAGPEGHYLFQSSVDDSAVKTSSDNPVAGATASRKGQPMYGWADVTKGAMGMAVCVRHMAEMWPNGIEVESNENVAVRLWPRWSAQWHEMQLSPTGLYWLEDMQQVVKETLFYFHGAETTEADLDAVAANHQRGLIAVLPIDEYRRTRVTFDLDGYVPADSLLDGGSSDQRTLNYSGYYTTETDWRYQFGWANYRGDVYRKRANMTGGQPRSSNAFMVSGKVDRYLFAEATTWGDLNVRPIWIAGYTHDEDYVRIQPTDRKYGSRSWRNFEGNSVPTMAAGYLAGTGSAGWYPRDNDHGWFYYIEDYYLMSGNLWVKDWYRWMAEFRKRSLLQTIGGEPNGDPSDFTEWSWSTRGEGHMLAQAIQAYKAIGDPRMIPAFRQRLNYMLHAYEQGGRGLSRRYGCRTPGGESVFQVGFLARQLCNLMVELRGYQPQMEAEAFVGLWGLMDWNYYVGKYSYVVVTNQGEIGDEISGTALSMPDPTALFYLWTGIRKHRDYMWQYIRGEFPGEGPYGGPWDEWNGSWEARLPQLTVAPKPNETPAAPISDLSASFTGGKVRLDWTTPANADRFLVLWSTRPISATFTQDEDKRNPWGCEPVGTNMKAVPGTRQSIEFDGVPAGTRIYTTVLTFTADNNLSNVSNFATVDVP